MFLRDILASKPHELVTLEEDHTIGDAINTMSEKNISATLIVGKNNKLISIFTERDIVHCIVDNISYDEPLKNVLRYDIVKFDPSATISSAISVALRKNIRHIPVVEGDTLVGIVTFRDLVSYLLPEICYIAKQIY